MELVELDRAEPSAAALRRHLVSFHLLSWFVPFFMSWSLALQGCRKTDTFSEFGLTPAQQRCRIAYERDVNALVPGLLPPSRKNWGGITDRTERQARGFPVVRFNLGERQPLGPNGAVVFNAGPGTTGTRSIDKWFRGKLHWLRH